MRILFLSDNFPPETNAPATRTFEHARVWVEHGHDVTIVTCAPNFPSGKVHAGYRNVPRRVEVMDGIRVVRVWTYVTANQGTVRRSLDYLSFLLAAVPAALVERRPDVVVGTSPQFFAAWAASIVSRLRRVPFVFELRDLWPESIAAVGAARGRFAIRVLERVADALYERADAIVSVTDSYVGILAERGVPVSKITVVRNGVDLDEFVVTYVGTIGMAHGLSSTLEAARTTLGEPIRYLFVGEGAEKERLVREAARLGLSNVTFLAPQPRSRVPEILGASQAVLVHLRDAPLFATVIPSKIFEAMAMERPIILGVRGESAAIVERTRSGLVVSPEAPHELAAAIRRLAGDPGLAMRLGTNGRRAAETEFRRDTAAMKMLDVLLRSARPSDPTRPSSPDSRGAAPSGRPSTASRERRA
jgi:colanic acid biosynthesis glycosyl transferase WcaI